MSHVSDEVLVSLALGHEVDPADAEHVAGCPVCSTEVTELGQLRDLMREESRHPGPVRVTPGPQVWDRIVTATGDTTAVATEAHEPPALAEPEPEPEPEPVAPTPLEPRRRPRRVRGWWVAAVAAACLVLGLLVGRAVWRPDDSQQVLARTTLTTLDATKVSEGTAVLVQGASAQQLQVDTAPMQPQSAAGSGYVEVWLINTDGKRMVSLGVLSTEKATFSVPANAIAQGYTVVDLSRQQFDEKPGHSGDSIMRGTLPI
jgi:hypothetical protein